MLLIYTIVAGTIPLMVFPAACHEPPTQLASGAISGLGRVVAPPSRRWRRIPVKQEDAHENSRT
jgi:hypothetical protein